MRVSRVLRILGALCVLAVLVGPVVQAQDVTALLREQRFLTRAEELVRQRGERPPAMPWQPHPWADSLLLARLQALPWPAPAADTTPVAVPAPARERLVVDTVVAIPKLLQGFFERRFEDTEWAYYGSNHATRVDTTLTWRLRAALEAAYGSPTRTVVEIGQDTSLTLSNAAQFEYWLIVNDTIPVIVSDVGGPLDRGLVIATDRRLRDRLEELRDVLFEPYTRPHAPRAPFADYFYDVEGRRWYLAGYDGFRFVMRATPRPRLRMGRPLVEALR